MRGPISELTLKLLDNNKNLRKSEIELDGKVYKVKSAPSYREIEEKLRKENG